MITTLRLLTPPRANGTIEAVFAEVRKGFRCLRAEFKAGRTLWPEFLQLIQATLNTAPPAQLDCRTGPTCFPFVFIADIADQRTRLPHSNVIDEVGDLISEIQLRQIANVDTALKVVEDMLRQVHVAVYAAHRKRVAAHNARTHFRPFDFEPWDFVLRGLLGDIGMTKHRACGVALTE